MLAFVFQAMTVMQFLEMFLQSNFATNNKTKLSSKIIWNEPLNAICSKSSIPIQNQTGIVDVFKEIIFGEL